MLRCTRSIRRAFTISGFAGGEVFRSGCCFLRGRGRIFYFGPGHETYPMYFQPEVRRVIANAVQWAADPDRHPRTPYASEMSPAGLFERIS
jgi:trehalose utilization protein